jgi:hypothetical protein
MTGYIIKIRIYSTADMSKTLDIIKKIYPDLKLHGIEIIGDNQ